MKKFFTILAIMMCINNLANAGVDDSLSVQYDTVGYSVCQNRFPVYYDGERYDTTGLYFVENEDTAYYINVGQYQIYNDTIFDTIKSGYTYNKYNFYADKTGIYTRRLRSIYGCDSIVTLNLIAYTDIEMTFPTAFTPDRPTNQLFTYWVSDTANFELDSFEIFARNGACVFKTSDKEEYWDGTNKGKLCPSGLYVYRMYYRYKFTGRILYEKHGEVFLLK